MPKFKIYLIEDEPKHAEETMGKLQEAAHERESEYEFASRGHQKRGGQVCLL